MKIAVIGAGGIGAFYGMILHSIGCEVLFIARGENLKHLQTHPMKITHPNYTLEANIKTTDLETFVQQHLPSEFDAIILATKGMSTEAISHTLGQWSKNASNTPYFISLQNGVENEQLMAKYYSKEHVIGGLTRLIVSHTVRLGHVHCEGGVETLIGALHPTQHNQIFLESFKAQLDQTPTQTILCENIMLELWNKLIVNNGVNAICALVEEESGPLLKNEKTARIIYGLMSEAASASKAMGVNLTQEDAKKMFELYKNFQSVKPSMWVDKENNRPLELDQICGAVIRNCEKQGLDAPYTRTVSTLLEFTYKQTRG